MSQVVGLDMVTGMGFIGLEPGRLYKIGQSPKLKDQTASGNPLLLNSAEAPLTSLTLYGWSKQDGTPSPDNPVPIVSAGSVMVESKNLWRNPKPSTMEGVTLTYEGNYKVLNGTCTASANFQLLQNTLFAGEYTLSAEVQGDCPDNFASLVQIYSSSTGFNMQIPNNNRNPVTNTLAETINDAYFRVRIDVGFQYNNVKIRVMLNAGQTALPYEPYFTPYADPDEGEINVTVQGGNLFDSSQLDDENNFDKSFSGSGYWIIKFPVPSEDITVSVGKISNVNDCYFAVSSSYGVEDVYRQWFVHSTATNGKTSVTYSKNEHGEYIYLYFRNMMAAVQKALNECDYIQIEVGDTATQYMPYKTPQTLTAQTPGGLPGIPVSSGGNYTDESGQQWICDEVDFSRGKYVKRVNMKTFDGSKDEFWSTYVTPGYEGFAINILDMLVTESGPGLSNLFPIGGVAGQPRIRLGANNNRMYMNNTNPDIATTVDEWLSWLSNNPLRVLYVLETPIETDLSDEEMAAYKALHTYSPATTVSNDAGAWMKVGYKANA